jgi:hypothetical protein
MTLSCIVARVQTVTCMLYYRSLVQHTLMMWSSVHVNSCICDQQKTIRPHVGETTCNADKVAASFRNLMWLVLHWWLLFCWWLYSMTQWIMLFSFQFFGVRHFDLIVVYVPNNCLSSIFVLLPDLIVRLLTFFFFYYFQFFMVCSNRFETIVHNCKYITWQVKYST